MSKVNKKKEPKLGRALYKLVTDFSEAAGDARWENDQGNPTSAAAANDALESTRKALYKRLSAMEEKIRMQGLAVAARIPTTRI